METFYDRGSMEAFYDRGNMEAFYDRGSMEAFYGRGSMEAFYDRWGKAASLFAHCSPQLKKLANVIGLRFDFFFRKSQFFGGVRYVLSISTTKSSIN